MSDEARKKQIIELLKLLASDKQQLEYEKNVPHVDITAELLCMWFDNLFHGKPPHAEPSFTAEENAALSEFHQFYRARVDRLPKSEGTVQTWLDSAVWRDIMENARSTLERVAV